MRCAVVLFTRDLRVRDQPALAAAAREAERVVPLFVLDDAILGAFGAPNRVAFLRESLEDLHTSLAGRGAGLAIRRGDTVEQALRVARAADADAIFLSADVSATARRRERRLREEGRLEVRACPGVTVVPPDELAASGRDHYAVFTPYLRAWSAAPRRTVDRAPRSLRLPDGIGPGRLPALPSGTSAERPRGGETAGRERLARFLRSGLARYEERADDLGADATSRLSPYLHFGCLSPLEVAERAAGREGGAAFVRQLAWRDFFQQLLRANPASPREDLRRHRRWRRDPRALERWQQGRTGIPVVDAGMRQLAREGFMHNRARLLVGSLLTKDLGLDWRAGAAHFFALLADGDLASNVGNWQWVAGTGADTRPNRRFNPTRQAKRFDADGAYVRRYVPELEGLDARGIHEPWRLGDRALRRLGYPAPILTRS